MVFENKIVGKSKKLVTITEYNLDTVKDVIKNIFDGVYNRKEIFETLAWIEERQDIDPTLVRDLFDGANLSNLCYQDIDGVFKVMSAHIILKLGFNDSNIDDYDTVTLYQYDKDNKLKAGDTKKDMKSILGSYKKLIKDFNNARK